MTIYKWQSRVEEKDFPQLLPYPILLVPYGSGNNPTQNLKKGTIQSCE